MFSPEQPGRIRKKCAMPRDNVVTPFREMRERRKNVVNIERPAKVWIVRQRFEHGFGSVVNRTIGFNQLHGGIEGGLGNFWKTLADLRVLRREIIDRIARGALPPMNPQRAKAAVAVINH